MSKTYRLATQAVSILQQASIRPRIARSQPADIGIRPQDLPLQGLCVHIDAALPLAVQLLPQSRLGQGDDWMNEIYELDRVRMASSS